MWHRIDDPDNPPPKDGRDRDPEIHINWIGGKCPVQAEGRVGAKHFYFRARGERWWLEVSDVPDGDPIWSHTEPHNGGPYAAGWMPSHEALGLIAKAIGLYAAPPTEHTP